MKIWIDMKSKIRPHGLIWTNKDGNLQKVLTSNLFNLNKLIMICLDGTVFFFI